MSTETDCNRFMSNWKGIHINDPHDQQSTKQLFQDSLILAKGHIAAVSSNSITFVTFLTLHTDFKIGSNSLQFVGVIVGKKHQSHLAYCLCYEFYFDIWIDFEAILISLTNFNFCASPILNFVNSYLWGKRLCFWILWYSFLQLGSSTWCPYNNSSRSFQFSLHILSSRHLEYHARYSYCLMWTIWID